MDILKKKFIFFDKFWQGLSDNFPLNLFKKKKKIEIKVISFKFDTNDTLVDSLLQVGNF